jgi:hypothetical protein
MVKRKPYLDRSLPTMFTLAIPLAVFSLWSDVWEVYWGAFTLLFLANIFYFKDVIRRSVNSIVIREVSSALPRAHTETSLKPPGNGDLEGFDDIHTGSQQSEKLIPIHLKILGFLTWIFWFGLGVKFWWFSDTTLTEFIVATILWILTFVFTTAGIPLVRALLNARNNGL